MSLYDNNKVFYREEQQFRQTWVWILTIPLFLITWYGFFQQIIIGTPFGNKPMPDFLLLIFLLLFGIGFPCLFYFLKMVTEVRNDSIRVRLFPITRIYYFKDIKDYTIRHYDWLTYGGWGIRKGALNISGNSGVELLFQDNKKILIGSQQVETLFQAIREITQASH